NQILDHDIGQIDARDQGDENGSKAHLRRNAVGIKGRGIDEDENSEQHRRYQSDGKKDEKMALAAQAGLAQIAAGIFRLQKLAQAESFDQPGQKSFVVFPEPRLGLQTDLVLGAKPITLASHELEP